jgi:hypothetical protein
MVHDKELQYRSILLVKLVKQQPKLAVHLGTRGNDPNGNDAVQVDRLAVVVKHIGELGGVGTFLPTN